MALGYLVSSITSDKNTSLVSAVKTFYLNIPHQYCTVHIQRRCQTLLTKSPETYAGRDLLELTRYINKIKTQNDKTIFLKWLNRYELKYSDFLKQRTYSSDPSSTKKWCIHIKMLEQHSDTSKLPQIICSFSLKITKSQKIQTD